MKVTLVVIGFILLVFCAVYTVNHFIVINELTDACEINAPKDMDLLFVDTISKRCDYESVSTVDFRRCSDYYQLTNNHGLVIDHFKNSSCYIWR